MPEELLVSGYLHYASAEEFGAAVVGAPDASPVWFATASSPECLAFSIAASAGAVTATLAWGC